MLLYARRPPAPEPAPPPPPADVVSEPDPTLPPDEVDPGPADLYCPFCARALADDYDFCPGCGHDTEPFHRCTACGGWQFVPAELDAAHCGHCGQDLG